MDEKGLLPHLAAACNELLGGDDEKLPPPGVRSKVAGHANVGGETVARFLKGQNTPRSENLDAMVSAVAKALETSWLVPWQRAVGRAIEQGEAQQPSADHPDPPAELKRILADAVRQAGSTGSHTAKPKPASEKT